MPPRVGREVGGRPERALEALRQAAWAARRRVRLASASPAPPTRRPRPSCRRRPVEPVPVRGSTLGLSAPAPAPCLGGPGEAISRGEPDGSVVELDGGAGSRVDALDAVGVGDAHARGGVGRAGAVHIQVVGEHRDVDAVGTDPLRGVAGVDHVGVGHAHHGSDERVVHRGHQHRGLGIVAPAGGGGGEVVGRALVVPGQRGGEGAVVVGGQERVHVADPVGERAGLLDGGVVRREGDGAVGVHQSGSHVVGHVGDIGDARDVVALDLHSRRTQVEDDPTASSLAAKITGPPAGGMLGSRFTLTTTCFCNPLTERST